MRLVFLGLGHPSPAVDAMSMADRAVALARALGVEGRHVFFSREWVPYERRLDYFREADLGVSAHLDTTEARFAFRTRLLDHFAAGTPVVTTSGDVLAELVAARGLGRVVAPGDVEGWVGALQELLAHRAKLKTARENVASARAELAWESVAGPLFRLVDAAPAPVRRRADVAIGRTAVAVLRSSLTRRGIKGTAMAAVGRQSRPPGGGPG